MTPKNTLNLELDWCNRPSTSTGTVLFRFKAGGEFSGENVLDQEDITLRRSSLKHTLNPKNVGICRQDEMARDWSLPGSWTSGASDGLLMVEDQRSITHAHSRFKPKKAR
jgi:hypothetical protein